MAIEIDYESSLAPGTEAVVFLGIMRTSDGAWVGEWISKDFVDADTMKVTNLRVRLQAKGTIRVVFEPLLLVNGQYDFWLVLDDGANVCCEARHLAPFFAARTSHVHDRGPVFSQPGRLLSAGDTLA